MRLVYQFLVVPYLTSHVILGNDWMSRNEVILNYKDYSIEVGGRLLSRSTVIFERSASEALIRSREDEITFIFVVNCEAVTPKEFIQENKDDIRGWSENFPT